MTYTHDNFFVVETYPSIQGEGKYIGVPSYFIRTTRCNLRCKFYNPEDNTYTLCDTYYTSWYPEKGYNLDENKINEILLFLTYKNIRHIVITGGEPLIQKKGLLRILNKLKNVEKITFETNATVYIPELLEYDNVFFSFSPKLKSSYPDPNQNYYENKLHTQNNQFVEVLEKYLQHNIEYQLKFVVSDIKNDIKEIKALKEILNFNDRNVYLMPQGTTKKDIEKASEKIIHICMDNGWNFSTRLHILIWDNKRLV